MPLSPRHVAESHRDRPGGKTIRPVARRANGPSSIPAILFRRSLHAANLRWMRVEGEAFRLGSIVAEKEPKKNHVPKISYGNKSL
jgi:hypothetical protein